MHADANRNETFELLLDDTVSFNIIVYDRQLVGKHTIIGSGTLKLEPRMLADTSEFDCNVALLPRGSVQIRVSTQDAGQKSASMVLENILQSLERTEKDILREFAEKIVEPTRVILSTDAVANLTKSAKGKNKAPAPLTDAEIEASLGPLFELLNANVSLTLLFCSKVSLTMSLRSSPFSAQL